MVVTEPTELTEDLSTASGRGVAADAARRICAMEHAHGAAFVAGIAAGAATPHCMGGVVSAMMAGTRPIAAVAGRVCYCNVGQGLTIWFWSEPTRDGEWWLTPYCPEPGSPTFDADYRVFTSVEEQPQWSEPCAKLVLPKGMFADVPLDKENREVADVLAACAELSLTLSL